jgi:hypothetical protein
VDVERGVDMVSDSERGQMEENKIQLVSGKKISSMLKYGRKTM